MLGYISDTTGHEYLSMKLIYNELNSNFHVVVSQLLGPIMHCQIDCDVSTRT